MRKSPCDRTFTGSTTDREKWSVTADRTLVFVEFSDQRLYRLDDGGSTPVPLTPAGRGFRFADISIRGSEVIAVRGAHTDGAVTREIVPPAQAELFRDALAAKGLPHAYLAYEGESHGFRRAEMIIDAIESELSLYGQMLGFEPPGVPRLTLSEEIRSGAAQPWLIDTA